VKKVVEGSCNGHGECDQGRRGEDMPEVDGGEEGHGGLGRGRGKADEDDVGRVVACT